MKKKLFIAAILMTLSFSLIYNSAIEKRWLFSFFNDKNLPDQQHAFSEIYRIDAWGGGSGGGSDPKNAQPYLEILQTYFSDSRFNKIVDLGCGDWRLMEKIIIPQTKTYIGYDLVKSVIEENSRKHLISNVKFVKIQNVKDIENETGDLLIVKDVIQHWSNKNIYYFIEHILPNFKYALITNDFVENSKNIDIFDGEFRPLDLQSSPYKMNNLTVIADYPAHGIIKRVYLYTNPKK